VRENPWTVQATNRQSVRLRAAAVLGCVALVVTLAVVTSLLVREPDPAPIRAIELAAPTTTPRPARAATPKPKRKRPAVTPTPTRTATPTRTTEPGGFAPPTTDDVPDDDPFDDEPGDDADDDGD